METTEFQPLLNNDGLSHNNQQEQNISQDGESGGCKRGWKKIFPRGLLPDLKILSKLATPIVLTAISEYVQGMIATVFCGRLGAVEMEASALAVSMITVTGIAFASGMSSACNTVFSQTFGSSNRHRLGIALQRSLLIISMCAFPCWALQLNIETILLLIGQNPRAAKLAGDYLLHFTPGLLVMFICYPIQSYLQCQEVVLPGVIIGFICNGLNIALHYILLVVLNYKTNASAIALACTWASMLMMLVSYTLISGLYKQTWQGWSKECLTDWGSFIKLSYLGVLIDAVEWWTFEIGIFMAGILGTIELDAQAISNYIVTGAYMIHSGVGVAAGIRVGQYLGQEDKDGAINTIRVALVIGYALGAMLGLLNYTLRTYIIQLFTDIPDIANLLMQIIPILAATMVVDMTGVCIWILEGAGRQNVGAPLRVVTYTIALIVASVLMFKTGLGVRAFWIVMLCANVIESGVCYLLFHTSDWEGLIAQALLRSTRPGEPAVDKTAETVSITNTPKQDILDKSEVQEDIEPDSISDNLPHETNQQQKTQLTKTDVLHVSCYSGAMIGFLILGVSLRLLLN